MRTFLLILSVGLFTGCTSLGEHSAVSKPTEWVLQDQHSILNVKGSAWAEVYPSMLPLLEGAVTHHADIRTQLLQWTSLSYTSQNIEKSTLPVVDGSMTSIRNRDTQTTTTSGALSLTGVIDIFGRIRQEGLSAKRTEEGAWWQYIYARNTVLNTVVKQALLASYQQQQKQYHQRWATWKETLYRHAVMSHQVGRLSQQEVDTQEQQWKDAKVLFTQSANAYQDTLLQLSQWTQVPVEQVEQAITSITMKDPQWPSMALSPEVLLTRPDISAAWKNAESSTYARLGSDRLRYPTITFGGQWSLTSIHNAGVGVTNEGISIGPLSISIPLWDNGVIARKQQLAAANEYAAWQKVGDTVVSAMKEYDHNQRILAAARQEWTWHHQTVLQKQKMYDHAKMAYQVGRESQDNMNNEQMKYEQAELEGYAIALKWWQNYADVQYSIGAF